MSPSRRRAIGAVRGLAVGRDVLIAPPRHGAVRGLASCEFARHAHVTIRTRITHGHGTMRRDGDIAPYRHYTRNIHTQGVRRHYPRALRGYSPNS